MIIVFLGPPGSGKGTQAELMADRLDYTHLSTGRMLRSMAENDAEIAKIINSGRLIPDDQLLDILKSYLKSNNLFNNLILDGSPRTVYQYKELSEWLKAKKAPIKYVIYLDIDQDTAVNRISFRRHDKITGKIYNLKTNPPPSEVDFRNLEERKDQTPDTVKERFEIYFNNTYPLVEYLRKRNKLIEIDGTQSIETIHYQILEVIGKI